MSTSGGTLGGMDRDELIAYTADRVLEHGGVVDSLFEDLRNKLTGTEIEIENNDLGQGELFALCALYVFQEVDAEILSGARNGADLLRKIIERHRLLAAGAPKRRGGWLGWGAR